MIRTEQLHEGSVWREQIPARACSQPASVSKRRVALALRSPKLPNSDLRPGSLGLDAESVRFSANHLEKRVARVSRQNPRCRSTIRVEARQSLPANADRTRRKAEPFPTREVCPACDCIR